MVLSPVPLRSPQIYSPTLVVSFSVTISPIVTLLPSTKGITITEVSTLPGSLTVNDSDFDLELNMESPG